ncbi:helix-turn-helix transcriptional regulator [Mycobacterium sp. 050134]|uniref:helix-turn-helix transcriptional regulator n=1 Tax=Mycobacterium sp. 050134 TaxID=3096111 RepID=UPI002ED790A0
MLHSDTVAAWVCECRGLRRERADEEHVAGTRIAFPYRGVYVHSVGGEDFVADPNHMVFMNAGEPYRVSHPIAGGDATLTLAIDPEVLSQVAPPEYRSARTGFAFNRAVMPVDSRTQLLVARLRERLMRRSIDPLEAESVAVDLVGHALGGDMPRGPRHGNRRPALMADRVKLLLAADPWRRWTLATIAKEVSVTPVYLTDAFRRAEGVPLYRYHLRLRLALALTVLSDCDDLMTLAVELGFNSHSHFSAAFKKAFGQTPSEFTRSLGGRPLADAEQSDGTLVHVPRAVFNGCRKSRRTAGSSVTAAA